jgi:hypothetical protein
MLKRKVWYKSAAGSMLSYRFGDNEINFENFLCRKGDQKVQFTAHEAMFLKYY